MTISHFNFNWPESKTVQYRLSIPYEDCFEFFKYKQDLRAKTALQAWANSMTMLPLPLSASNMRHHAMKLACEQRTSPKPRFEYVSNLFSSGKISFQSAWPDPKPYEPGKYGKTFSQQLREMHEAFKEYKK